MLPKEHGSWVILAVPPIVAATAAGTGGAGVWVLFFCGLLGTFLVRTPLEALLRNPRARRPRVYLAGYLLLAAGGFLPLMWVYGRWGLLLLAAPGAAVLALNIRFNLNRKSLIVTNKIAGVLALCLGAPAAHYAAVGRFLAAGGWLWLLNGFYFVGPVFHVNMLLARRKRGESSRARAHFTAGRRAALIYHGTAALAASLLAIRGYVPALAVISLWLALGKTAWKGSRSGRDEALKSIGYQEVGWSILFMIFLIAAY